ncbi:PIN domain-containing protein [Acanthamoeba castellanii medusavirus]|uniref:PIN domain-containing protein n=1 Tax=Acanthamoeba castellanii medusavirus J1 TaxID=3114988 RepID=A0A3T1CWT3_9VIRU|nr:PIN domain-containing protein [Acanthamoeba castellanii medusavirus]BBI30278.1 PIN domain-containing protein [Acanthamoeba castellanii medusavirus J1]
MHKMRSAMRVAPFLADAAREARFLVVDTNAWIDSLDSVILLRKQRRLTVVVPSAVVQELDGLKQKQDALGGKARAAIKTIYDATATGEDSWIRGQRYDENLGTSMRIANRDDEILSCAVYFNTYVAPAVLVTGDYGLAAKCNINRVATANMAGLIDHLFRAEASPSPPVMQPRPTKKCKVEIPGFVYTVDALPPSPPAVAPKEATLLSLPVELQSKVLSLLPPRALLRTEEVCSGMRYLLSPRNKRSRAIWAASLQRSHGRLADGYGHKHPKHWYYTWRRSVTAPSR